MKRIVSIVLAIAAVACGGANQPGGRGGTKLRFAVIPKSLDLPVFNYAKVGAVNQQARLSGARAGLARQPEMQVVELYGIKEDPVRGAEIIASGTNRYPDLGAWISVDGWPVFTRNALASAPPQTRVISFDT